MKLFQSPTRIQCGQCPEWVITERLGDHMTIAHGTGVVEYFAPNSMGRLAQYETQIAGRERP